MIMKNKHYLKFILKIYFYCELSSLKCMYMLNNSKTYSGMSFFPYVWKMTTLIEEENNYSGLFGQSRWFSQWQGHGQSI